MKPENVPVTQKMLFGVRDELKELINSKVDGLRSEFHETKSDIHGIKSDIHEMKSDRHDFKAECHDIRSDMHSMKSDMHEMKSDIHGIKSELHRIGVLVEEQNSRNQVVLDGIALALHRQDRMEDEMGIVKKFISNVRNP